MIVSAAGDGNQFSQDGVFQFELDAVGDRLEHDLDGVVANELDDDHGDVKDENNDVDDEELVQDTLRSTVGAQA